MSQPWPSDELLFGFKVSGGRQEEVQASLQVVPYSSSSSCLAVQGGFETSYFLLSIAPPGEAAGHATTFWYQALHV
jgi:hypothetical protein